MLPAATFGTCHKGYRLPARSAASVYSRRRSFDSLSSYRSSSGLSDLGLPGGRLGCFMGLIRT